MKKLCILFVTLVMSSLTASLFAQGTAFSYQGRLFDGTNAANGTYDLTFALFDAGTNGRQSGLTLTNSATAVSNGLFEVTLDFGGGIFDGTNRWLAIGVRTNGGGAFTALARQEILPVPYAIYASDAGTAISATSVAPGAVTAGSIANGAINATNIAGGQVVKSLNGLTDAVLLAGGTNILIGTNGNTLTFSAASGGAGWSLVGNAGTKTNLNFVGTTDNQPLEMHVNGLRAMRLEPNANGAPNVIGGAAVNTAGSSTGAMIGGGTGHKIGDLAVNATIGGGTSNSIGGATLSGVIAGGLGNSVAGNSVDSTIGGGTLNSMGGATSNGVIAGGLRNNVAGNSVDSTIGGGGYNDIGMTEGVLNAVIAGGGTNSIGDGSSSSAISGGENNTISFNVPYSMIGGGNGNYIHFDASSSVIAGGNSNNIDFNAAESAIVGGSFNNVYQSSFGFIGGGFSNRIDPDGGWSFIGGGSNNNLNALYGVIGGGASNHIAANCPYSSITGGQSNVVTASFTAYDAAIAGGLGNQINSSAFSAIGGGQGNLLGPKFFTPGFSVIAGGVSNVISFADEATIGGGAGNVVSNAFCATVPGGSNNMATGTCSFAAGRNARATHDNCFVWSDGRAATFGSTGDSQFCIQAAGGVVINALPANGDSLTVSNGLTTDYLTVGASISCYTISSSSGFFTDSNIGCGTLTAKSNLSSLGTISANGDISSAGGALSCWGNITTQNGSVYAQGMMLTSDRNQKEKFAPIDSQDVLARVASLPITSWNFKTDRQTRHVGPMAQDFYSAFNVGADDKHISVVDEGGVALAAIQGLNRKLQDELRTKDVAIQSLEQRLARLEKLVSALEDVAQDAP